MKKNSKGFTLIELLAVIVILAIIALIATPVILNIIKKARISATQDSAYALRKTASLYYSTSLMEDPNFAGAKFKCDSAKMNEQGRTCVIQVVTPVEGGGPTETDGTEFLELDGTNPTAGTIEITGAGDVKFTGITYGSFTCHSDKEGTKDMTSQGNIYCKD